MVSLTALLILLALLVPLPPAPMPDDEAELARRLDHWIPKDGKYWGHD